jgi:hypothetical protein
MSSESSAGLCCITRSAPFKLVLGLALGLVIGAVMGPVAERMSRTSLSLSGLSSDSMPLAAVGPTTPDERSTQISDATER